MKKPRRVVSLIASATEIICALGQRKILAGRSHECDYPPGIKKLPVLTRPKLNAELFSSAIDAQVKDILRSAVSVYNVDAAQLKRLKPDVIVTQSQCEVCAVSLKDVEAALCGDLGFQCEVVSLKSDSLSDVWRDILSVAAALGSLKQGRELISELRTRLAAISLRAARLKTRPRIACVEWIEPLMAAGNWMPELVALAGGVNLFGEAGRHSPWMTWTQLRARNPDVILILPCGFDIARSRREMPALTRKPGWKSLKAARTGQVYLADGNQYFNRPGPRLVESLEILAEILHPQSFDFGHRCRGWQRL